MRGFKRAACVDIIARAHVLIQNLRNGCSTLTAAVVRNLRLATAWAQLVPAI
jgi:hypothetical protein